MVAAVPLGDRVAVVEDTNPVVAMAAVKVRAATAAAARRARTAAAAAASSGRELDDCDMPTPPGHGNIETAGHPSLGVVLDRRL